MTLKAIEDTIVIQVKASITDAQVAPFPDDPTSLKHRKAKTILVAVVSESKVSNKNGRGTLQDNDQQIILTYVYKNRREHQGVLEDIETVKGDLSGFKIDTTFLSQAGWNFQQYDQTKSRWIYTQTFNRIDHYDNR
ncbi:Gp37 family protein [Gracilimonas sediminicola]|uniref:Gp37 family protein n=1 Tax=Gracilimonas sediminicola TaxID=2952158 RepID=A0A9X2RCI6_9BACT|nr:Gp37 family protein [Gracilimonas sediminicola]MCP9289992.1 Gp37 family protein [Gracilimonas sediminicola]